jgi:hypothetical protein
MSARAFVGIDVAFAKKKTLPVCVCTMQDGRLTPLHLKLTKDQRPPKGRGNRLSIDNGAVDLFVADTIDYLRAVERGFSVRIACIAIDAPSAPCAPGTSRRSAEVAMDRAGYSCFATPTREGFAAIVEKVRAHLGRGGAETNLPHANQLWMLVGFALFAGLRQHWRCREVFPHAIVRSLGVNSGHKSTKGGLLAQIAAAAAATGWTPDALRGELRRLGFGPEHDLLDAYLAAWVASLPDDRLLALGSLPDDVIWVPTGVAAAQQ